MHKTTEILKKIISCVLISGFGAVTVLGLVWLVGNIKSAGASAPNMPAWASMCLIIVQIFAVVSALFSVAGAFLNDKKITAVTALFVAFSPFMLQTMLEISFRPWMIAAFFFLLSAIFGCKEKKKLAILIIYFVILVSLLVPVKTLCENPLVDIKLNRYGSWHLFSLYDYMQYEGVVDIPFELLMEEHYTTNGARDVVIPYIDNLYDKESGDEIKTYLVELSKRVHKKALTREIAIDAGSYVFSPQFVSIKLSGRSGPSHVPNLYLKFVEIMPVFGNIYMKFFLWWSNIALALGGLSLFLWKRKKLIGWAVGALAAVIMVVVYTFRAAAAFDYRDVCFILSLWNLFILIPVMENLKLHDRD